MQTGTLGDACAGYLGEYLRKVRFCVERLSYEQLWWRPSPGVNSVANLLLHLRGNLSQWALGGLAGEAYERHRDQEFAASGGVGGSELLDELTVVVERCQSILRRLGEDDLRRRHHVQGYDTDGRGVVLHVTEHMSYHTGQIVLLTKQLMEDPREMEFYPQHRGE